MTTWGIDHGKLDDTKQDIYHIYDEDDEHIAKVFGRDKARLISKAPNLLDELEKLLKMCEDVMDVPQSAYDVVKEARDL